MFTVSVPMDPPDICQTDTKCGPKQDNMDESVEDVVEGDIAETTDTSPVSETKKISCNSGGIKAKAFHCLDREETFDLENHKVLSTNSTKMSHNNPECSSEIIAVNPNARDNIAKLSRTIQNLAEDQESNQKLTRSRLSTLQDSIELNSDSLKNQSAKISKCQEELANLGDKVKEVESKVKVSTSEETAVAGQAQISKFTKDNEKRHKNHNLALGKLEKELEKMKKSCASGRKDAEEKWNSDLLEVEGNIDTCKQRLEKLEEAVTSSTAEQDEDEEGETQTEDTEQDENVRLKLLKEKQEENSYDVNLCRELIADLEEKQKLMQTELEEKQNHLQSELEGSHYIEVDGEKVQTEVEICKLEFGLEAISAGMEEINKEIDKLHSCAHQDKRAWDNLGHKLEENGSVPDLIAAIKSMGTKYEFMKEIVLKRIEGLEVLQRGIMGIRKTVTGHQELQNEVSYLRAMVENLQSHILNTGKPNLRPQAAVEVASQNFQLRWPAFETSFRFSSPIPVETRPQTSLYVPLRFGSEKQTSISSCGQGVGMSGQRRVGQRRGSQWTASKTRSPLSGATFVPLATSALTSSAQQTIPSVLTSNTGQTVSSVLTSSTGQTVSSVLTSRTGLAVSSVLTSSTGQTVSSVSTSSTGQTVSSVLTSSTGQAVSSVLTSSTGQTVSSALASSTGQIVSSALASSTGQTVSSVPKVGQAPSNILAFSAGQTVSSVLASSTRHTVSSARDPGQMASNFLMSKTTQTDLGVFKMGIGQAPTKLAQTLHPRHCLSKKNLTPSGGQTLSSRGSVPVVKPVILGASDETPRTVSSTSCEGSVCALLLGTTDACLFSSGLSRWQKARIFDDMEELFPSRCDGLTQRPSPRKATALFYCASASLKNLLDNLSTEIDETLRRKTLTTSEESAAVLEISVAFKEAKICLTQSLEKLAENVQALRQENSANVIDWIDAVAALHKACSRINLTLARLCQEVYTDATSEDVSQEFGNLSPINIARFNKAYASLSLAITLIC